MGISLKVSRPARPAADREFKVDELYKFNKLIK